jgi:hypothetical protein
MQRFMFPDRRSRKRKEITMGTEEIEKALLDHHGLRITPAMSEYIIAALKSSPRADVPIIAGDARTGMPIRTVIPGQTLQAYVSPEP